MRSAPLREPASVRLLRAGTQVLRRAGVGSAQLDAGILLASALGTSRFELLLSRPSYVPAAARRRYARLVRARSRHEPVAYLVGSREFMGRTFRVDRRVLVPRPETELLAQAAIDLVAARAPQAARVLEIGCGSGCVAVSIALASPGAHVVATDVSEDALEVARTNVAALAPGRVDLRQGDLFAPVEHEAPFHVVVSNPPYVGAAELAHVDRAVKEHEPASAWLAGDDPLRFHVRILDAATARVAPGGAVLLELGSGARRLVAEARARIPGSTAAILRDLSGAPRVARIDLPA